MHRVARTSQGHQDECNVILISEGVHSSFQQGPQSGVRGTTRNSAVDLVSTAGPNNKHMTALHYVCFRIHTLLYHIICRSLYSFKVLATEVHLVSSCCLTWKQATKYMNMLLLISGSACVSGVGTRGPQDDGGVIRCQWWQTRAQRAPSHSPHPEFGMTCQPAAACSTFHSKDQPVGKLWAVNTTHRRSEARVMYDIDLLKINCFEQICVF